MSLTVSPAKLAIDGGTAICERTFGPWPHFPADEIAAVTRVLESGKVNYWTGNEGKAFEKEFAAAVGCSYAVAACNGTAALEMALYALGIGQGDEVIVPSRTFIASASCAAMRGATPVCVDIDRVTQNLTVDTILPAITPRTRAIIPVHLAGWPCDMTSIMDLARARNLKVVEDCAQAQGAFYKGRHVGSFGDMAAFSFCQDKIISTGGDGGMLVTNDPHLWQRAWSFKDHGKNPELCSSWAPSVGFRWLHESFGTNLRLTEMQSAIGRAQLAKLDENLSARRRNAAILTKAFLPLSALRVTHPPKEIVHAYYKYYAFLRLEMLREGWTRDRVLAAVRAEGIPCFSGSCSEIYLEKAFPENLRPAQRLEVARELGETSLMFMVHPTLSEADMVDTGRAVEKVLEAATSFPHCGSLSQHVPLDTPTRH